MHSKMMELSHVLCKTAENFTIFGVWHACKSAILPSACQKNRWLSQIKYRPKRPWAPLRPYPKYNTSQIKYPYSSITPTWGPKLTLRFVILSKSKRCLTTYNHPACLAACSLVYRFEEWHTSNNSILSWPLPMILSVTPSPQQLTLLWHDATNVS